MEDLESASVEVRRIGDEPKKKEHSLEDLFLTGSYILSGLALLVVVCRGIAKAEVYKAPLSLKQRQAIGPIAREVFELQEWRIREIARHEAGSIAYEVADKRIAQWREDEAAPAKVEK